MYKSKISKSLLSVVLLFFAFYLAWLYKAYKDVIWMDQVWWMAGNINHLYSHNFSLMDLYYLTPYNQSFSMMWSMINSKLFHYNTYIDNSLSAIILLLIALYFIRSHLHFFSKQAQWYFVAISSFIVFGLHKWEASLNGMGMGFYAAFFAVIVCIDLAHRYYLTQLTSTLLKKYFSLVYAFLGLFIIAEYGPYFIPFQVSLLVLQLLNRKLFRNKIDAKKWRTLLFLNIFLIVVAVLINYFLTTYAANHAYGGYPKVTMSQSLRASVETIVKKPMFVIRSFFIANTGNLIDNESYLPSSFIKDFIPFLGFLVILLYGYCIYLFIKKIKLEYLYSVNLILFVLIFYFLVTLSRLYFNDLYYGSSSRYTAATFSGILAVTTIFLMLLQNANTTSIQKKILLATPVIFICFCYLVSDRNQWLIAPYRKQAFANMIQNLKSNKNLQLLQGSDSGITELARNVMIKYRLNAFRAQNGLNNFTINGDLKNAAGTGFYNPETSASGQWRWTNGDADIFLPNLYTDRDSIRVKLFCRMPNADTPKIILNDNLSPLSCSKIDQGFEYRFKVYGPLVFYRARILNKSFVPHLLNKNDSDARSLGLVFNAIHFEE